MRRSLALLLLLLAAAPVSFAHAQAAAEVPPAPSAPRVVVVVRGDPSPALVDAATAFGTALAATNELSLPSDEAVRSALVGRAATADGLDELRAARRQIGWETSRDVELLSKIGAFTQASALVVVRDGTPPTAEIFDVARRHFYEGVTALDAPAYERATRFVRARARAASAHAAEVSTTSTAVPAPPAATATEGPNVRASSSVAVSPSAARAAVQGGNAARPTSGKRDRPARAFMRRAWPWFAAGIALATTITVFAVLQHRDNNPEPPVIHVGPGGT